MQKYISRLMGKQTEVFQQNIQDNKTIQREREKSKKKDETRKNTDNIW